MDSTLARFIRSGGRPAVALRLDAAPMPLERKEEPTAASRRRAFIARLVEAQQANGAMILGAVGEALGLGPADLADSPQAVRRAVADWESWVAPVDDPSDRAAIEDRLARRFASELNEHRQGALGIEGYVWRSRDDAAVRPGHAANDDREFRWDEPPEGGHPGESWGCRCWAEPVLPDLEDDGPRTGLDLAQFQARAEVAGTGQAIRDLAVDTALGVRDAAALARRADRWLSLHIADAFGVASAEERRELRAMDAALDASLDAILATAREAPALARALRDYVVAVHRRPAAVNGLYLRGLATEGDVWDAHRERAYVQTQIAGAALSAAGLGRSLLRGRGEAGLSDDPDALAAGLAAETARLARAPADVEWPTLPDPGIPWVGPIKAQGAAWERALEEAGQPGRLHDLFPTFDFHDQDTLAATSAKSLNTRAVTYVRRPHQIFLRLRRYIDDAADPRLRRLGNVRLRAEDLDARRIILAVRSGLTDEQRVQLRRAMEYAGGQSVDLDIRVLE